MLGVRNVSGIEQGARLGRTVKEHISGIEEFARGLRVDGLHEKWEERRVSYRSQRLSEDAQSASGSDCGRP